MKHLLQIMVVLGAAAATAAAQDAQPSPAAPAAPAAAPEASPNVAKDISSGLPHYTPQPPTPKPGDAAVDTQADKPKNQIPRLPVEEMARYVVHGKRLPTFRTRDLYTKEGLIELSFKEHPGLRIGNFFNLNSAYAYQLAINEAMFEDRQEVVDTTLAMLVGGDKGEADAMQQALIDESFENGTQEGPVGIK